MTSERDASLGPSLVGGGFWGFDPRMGTSSASMDERLSLNPKSGVGQLGGLRTADLPFFNTPSNLPDLGHSGVGLLDGVSDPDEKLELGLEVFLRGVYSGVL